MLSSPRDTSCHVGNITAEQGHSSLDSIHAQAQILIRALQDFVVPLVHSFDHGQNIQARPENAKGPEAAQLLVVLQEFILCVVRSQSVRQDDTGIEIDLEAEGGGTNASQTNETKEEFEPSTIPPESSVIVSGNSVNEDEYEPSEPTPLGKVLGELKEHVFNKMPIRLLCFTPHSNASKLHISLLDRSGIYSHLASEIQALFNEEEFLSEIKRYSMYHSNKASIEQQFVQEWVAKHARYAILSHTVTYGDWNKSVFCVEQAGYQKLVSFCKTASRDHGLSLGWMDTICINKESSTELDESIRSMYNWYQDSDVCIIYLAETPAILDMHKDPWFTRGWTLQELLAPDHIKFYDMSWTRLTSSSENDKWDSDILQSIERATTLTVDELHYIRGASISRRMQLAARREVTREEDVAYSLMGVFKVSVSIAYGEASERAFFRLLKKILNSSKDDVMDIFNWAGELPDSKTRISSLLPPHPSYYLHSSSDKQVILKRPIEPLTITHLGLRIPVLLMPAASERGMASPNIGLYYATIDIAATGYYEAIERIPNRYTVLEIDVTRRYRPDGWTVDGRFNMTVGVLNFGGDATSIHIPKTCLAVCLCVTGLGRVTKIHTMSPIIFELICRAKLVHTDDHYGEEISKLHQCGMKLLTMHL